MKYFNADNAKPIKLGVKRVRPNSFNIIRRLIETP